MVGGREGSCDYDVEEGRRERQERVDGRACSCGYGYLPTVREGSEAPDRKDAEDAPMFEGGKEACDDEDDNLPTLIVCM